MRYAIGGFPGSGTSTAAYLLADKTGLEVVSAGETFRQMARERGVSLADFGNMAQRDETIDISLDRRMLSAARSKEDIIVEGRLVGALCKKEKVDVFAVWLHASAEVRASRISGREAKDIEVVVREIVQRENSERTRYTRYYGIDMEDPKLYDLVIDSKENTPDMIVEKILEGRK